MQLNTSILLMVFGSLLFGGCFGTPEPPKKDNSSPANTQSTDTENTDKSSPNEPDGDSPDLSEIFSIKNKVSEIRYQYMNGQPSYALKQAEGVLPMLPPDSRERLELYFLMARCSEKLGNQSGREQHDKSFRELLEKLGNSKEQKQAHEDGNNVRKLIQTSIEKAEPLREKSIFDSDEELFNLRCYRKLKRATKNEVLEETMDDSGHIFFGNNPKSVIKEAASYTGLTEDDIVIHKDPRFFFYYVIIEGEQ